MIIMPKREREGDSEIKKIAWGEDLPENERKAFISKEREKLLKMPEIGIVIAGYNDIFSSFDPRPSSQRALSDDFLIEVKKASLVRESNDVELKMFLPVSQRNLAEESIIKKRLKDHFKKHEAIVSKEIHSIKRNSIFMIIMGILVMFFAAYISSLQSSKLMFSLILVITEPAGWFLFWKGLEIYRDEVKEKMPDFNFYKKMSGSKVNFASY